MKKKPRGSDLPAAGSVFLIPLEDGRFGACRILRSVENRMGYKRVILAELSRWIGREPPDLADPELRRPLRLTHHKWRGKVERVWSDAPAPDEFRFLGVLEPDARDRRVACYAHGSWAAFPWQRFMQWRWENEREAVLAEDAATALPRPAAVTSNNQTPPAPSIAPLQRAKHFESWTGHVPGQQLEAARQGGPRILPQRTASRAAECASAASCIHCTKATLLACLAARVDLAGGTIGSQSTTAGPSPIRNVIPAETVVPQVGTAGAVAGLIRRRGLPGTAARCSCGRGSTGLLPRTDAPPRPP
jgi:hypothetical protein